MSFVLAAPAALVTAASDLAGIGSTLSTANAAAAAPTTSVPAAAADEVSAQVAALFSEHGLGYQQLSTQVAAFHEQFVQTLTAGASTYAAAESNAVQTLVNAVNAPAAMVLGHPLIGSGASAGASSAAAGGIFSNLLGGSGAAASQASALLLRPTGMASALTAATPLLQASGITNAAAAPAAFGAASIGDAIENAYLAIEPYVQYGFNLAAYAAGYVIGGLAPQINFFYYLFEPIVQSALFNTLDWLGGTITFSQGLSNFWAATTASINQFINTEINWVRGFLPPLPPLP
jgi:PE family